MSLLVEIYYTRVLTLFCCLLPWQLYTRHLVGHCSVGADHLEIQTTQQFEIFLTKIVMSVQFRTLTNFSLSL